jgi:hypothetical protein
MPSTKKIRNLKKKKVHSSVKKSMSRKQGKKNSRHKGKGKKYRRKSKRGGAALPSDPHLLEIAEGMKKRMKKRMTPNIWIEETETDEDKEESKEKIRLELFDRNKEYQKNEEGNFVEGPIFITTWIPVFLERLDDNLERFNELDEPPNKLLLRYKRIIEILIFLKDSWISLCKEYSESEHLQSERLLCEQKSEDLKNMLIHKINSLVDKFNSEQDLTTEQCENIIKVITEILAGLKKEDLETYYLKYYNITRDMKISDEYNLKVKLNNIKTKLEKKVEESTKQSTSQVEKARERAREAMNEFNMAALSSNLNPELNVHTLAQN